MTDDKQEFDSIFLGTFRSLWLLQRGLLETHEVLLISSEYGYHYERGYRYER